MGIEQHTIDEIGPGRWDAFVRSHPHGSLYHLSAWHRVMKWSYGIETKYLVIFDESGEIRAGLPIVNLRNLFLGRRSVCYPFSDYCDPLVTKNEDLVKLVKFLTESAEPFEIRTHQLQFPVEGIGIDDSYSNYVIDLKNERGVLYSRLHSSCIRRKIRKAEASGILIREGRDPADLKDFYRLHLLTRRRLGLPTQPFLFFFLLWEEFGVYGDMKLLFAEHQGRRIGCLVLIGFKNAESFSGGGTMYYKYGASDARYFNQGVNPALFWRAILLAREEGYSVLDLGRASDIEEAGLGTFKLHLGSEKARLVYYSTTETYSGRGRFRTTYLAKKVLRKAPGCVSGLVGRCFYRFLG